MSQVTGVAGALGEWGASLRWQDVPASIQEQTRLIWLDSLGCLLLGGDHPEVAALAEAVAARGNRGAVPTIHGESLTTADAALVNAVAMGIDLFDGGNVASGGHVAGYVMPAVLAEAFVLDATFEDALTAFLVGYEVASRIGASQKLRASLHPSGTWNVIGAAAAVARLRGADGAALGATIELAANLTLTTSWDATVHGATVRNLYHAMPSFLGTQAADFAAAGFRGGPRSVEVTFSELSSTAPFDEVGCVADLGQTWVLEQTYTKLHPTCRSYHAVLDAVLELTASFDGDLGGCDVTIGADWFTYQQNGAVHHANALAARESLPVSAALGLVTGSITPEQFRRGAYADPAVVALAERIRLVELQRATPQSRPGWIELHRAGASVARHEVDIPLGNPGNLLPRSTVLDKFVTYSTGRLGVEAKSLADNVLDGPVDIPCSSTIGLDRWGRAEHATD